MTQTELNQALLDDLLHEHLTHDDSESVLIHNDNYSLMSYEETDQGFNLTFAGETIGTIEPLEGDQFKFEAVSDTLDHHNDLYTVGYHHLEDVLYMVFTEGVDP